MLSPRSVNSRTRRSISEELAPTGKREWTTTRFWRASDGKSHSWLTPQIESPRPSAKAISVDDGSREQMRIAVSVTQEPARNRNGEGGYVAELFSDRANTWRGSPGKTAAQGLLRP